MDEKVSMQLNSTTNGDLGNEYFRQEIVPIVKGFAIILMFTLHLLQTSWMTYPELIKDIKINNITISSILARGGDICIGIFAFITGYGWCNGFFKKSKVSRIFGVYRVYWLVLISFSFPMRVFFLNCWRRDFRTLQPLT